MSYSYDVIGKDAAEALKLSQAKFAEVVQNQPVHAVEQSAVLEAEEKLLALLRPVAQDEAVALTRNGLILATPEGKANQVSAMIDVVIRKA